MLRRSAIHVLVVTSKSSFFPPTPTPSLLPSPSFPSSSVESVLCRLDANLSAI
jgi:hypothetical protein